MQSIDLIETYAYQTRKIQYVKKKGLDVYIIKQYKNFDGVINKETKKHNPT